MPKFHVNGEGTPGPCRAGDGETAGVRGCPFGDATEHYDTPKEARAAYEKKMEDEAIPEASAKKSEPTIDPEVAEARQALARYGDDSYRYDADVAKKVAERLELKLEHVQAVIEIEKQVEEAEFEARVARRQVIAHEVINKTNPDISKIRKGATVALKDYGKVLMTVKLTAHRGGKIYGYASNGDYIDGWEDTLILTPDSKLD